jgi:hypothetical protein
MARSDDLYGFEYLLNVFVYNVDVYQLLLSFAANQSQLNPSSISLSGNDPEVITINIIKPVEGILAFCKLFLEHTGCLDMSSVESELLESKGSIL